MLHARATRDAPPHMPFPNSNFRKFSVGIGIHRGGKWPRGVASIGPAIGIARQASDFLYLDH